jgi:hypothetical protein
MPKPTRVARDRSNERLDYEADIAERKSGSGIPISQPRYMITAGPPGGQLDI